MLHSVVSSKMELEDDVILMTVAILYFEMIWAEEWQD